MSELFPELFPVAMCEMIAEVEREIRIRERKYPQWVAAGTLRKDTAEKQLARLRAVRDHLKGER